MSVLLIDNAFNLRINLGLIAQITGITDCHCFTCYKEAMCFLDKNRDKIKVAFINPNLDDENFDSFVRWLREVIVEIDLKVRILYKPYREQADLSDSGDKLRYTGMPITRNEIELLKMMKEVSDLSTRKKTIKPNRKGDKLKHPPRVNAA